MAQEQTMSVMTAEETMELLRVVSMLANKQGWKHNARTLDDIRLRVMHTTLSERHHDECNKHPNAPR
jgi:hypothetical protein